jgi:hypothetical protein
MLTLLATVALCATPDARVKLALPDVQAVGIDAKLGAFFGEHLANQDEEVASAMGIETHSPVGAKQRLFWLGLLGRGNANVKRGVVSEFRRATDQDVRLAAAEAIGTLGLAELTGELQGILSGQKKVGEWDNSDTEQVWHLLKALHFLGARDLAGYIPEVDLVNRDQLTQLATFLETGKIPSMRPEEAEELQKAQEQVRSEE